MIGISFGLFVMAFFLRQATCPDIIWSNDFYGYIELGRNIFQDSNFVVRWQLDNPMIYPPLFSILIYLLTLLTKDPLAAIRYLNAFSASFCLIPLFLVSRKLLNTAAAVLVTVFMIYFFAMSRPCYNPYSDYLFAFFSVVVFWLMWDVLTREKQKASAYVALGVVISLAYLAKYQGAIYCLFAVVLIFCFLKRKAFSPKIIFKKISLLLLGFLPIFLMYHVALYNNTRHEKACDVHVAGFLHGITGTDDRERHLYILNPEGSEFNQLKDYRDYTVVSFCSRWPGLVLARYKVGLKQIFEIMTMAVFPFSFTKENRFYITTQYILFALILISLLCRSFRFRLAYILLFASFVLFIPLYPVMERYLMPFVPFYFMLWLAGAKGIYCLATHNNKIKYLRHLVKAAMVILAVVLVYKYSLKFYDVASHPIPVESCLRQEYPKAVEWVKNDFKGKPGRPKIMSRKTSFAYLADAYFISLPYENSWDRIIKFALLKHVDYVILDRETLFPLRKDQWEYLTEVAPASDHIKSVYTDVTDNNTIRVFKVYP